MLSFKDQIAGAEGLLVTANDFSIFRMASNDPAARMPEIGRTLAHQRGLAVVSAWVESLPGECSEPNYRGALAAAFVAFTVLNG